MDENSGSYSGQQYGVPELAYQQAVNYMSSLTQRSKLRVVLRRGTF